MKIDLRDNTQNGHDVEFLKYQTNEYVKSYQEYLSHKSIPTFMRLKQSTAGCIMIKNQEGAYFLPWFNAY